MSHLGPLLGPWRRGKDTKRTCQVSPSLPGAAPGTAHFPSTLSNSLNSSLRARQVELPCWEPEGAPAPSFVHSALWPHCNSYSPFKSGSLLPSGPCQHHPGPPPCSLVQITSALASKHAPTSSLSPWPEHLPITCVRCPLETPPIPRSPRSQQWLWCTMDTQRILDTEINQCTGPLPKPLLVSTDPAKKCGC